MKKNLLTLLLSAMAVVSSRATVLFYEPFNYVNGNIIVVGTNSDGTTNWFRHSGSGNDAIETNHRLAVAATGGVPISGSDDTHRNFTSFTNTQGIVYNSFTVNCTNLPPAVGTYFAHVYGVETIHAQNLGTNFPARIFAQAGSLPGTWRVGVAGFSGTVNKIFPYDLATNTDYQVVEEWDPVSSFSAFLWVNPTSISDTSVQTSDGVSGPTIAGGFGFRQASAFGNFYCTISNLACATAWDEAATNVWATNAVTPVVVYNPKTGTNFVGDVVTLSGIAAGQGLANLTYLWLKDGAGLSNPNGNSNVFKITSAALADTGNYKLVATTPYGLSATSTVAFLWVTNAPVPPTISPTTNSTVAVFYHQGTTLSVSAIGPPTITYAWYFNNAPAGNGIDDGNGNYTLSDVFTNNGTTGAYYAVASNPFGSKTSGVFTVTAIGPPAVSIAFLRTLVDPVNFVATNSNLRWQTTGTVTTSTNITSGDTASYYIQDSTGCGINIFVTHGGGANVTSQRFFGPQQGDVVTFIGWLSSFNSSLELEADTNDITTGWTILSNNLASIPAPKVVPFSIPNNLPFMETNIEASIVILTNVYFGTNAGLVLSSSANTTVTVTNAAGETFDVTFSIQDLDLPGKTLPSFANMVAGPISQNLGNAVTPRNTAYLLNITRFSDIVTNPISLSVAHSGTSSTLTWKAAPYTYSYTIQAAGSVTGPYTNVATGLRFTSFSGTYTDTGAGAAAKFYRLTVP